MTPLDFAILGGYFLLVFGVAWAVTVRHRRAGAGTGAADYFLAGRNAGWLVIGASLFASNIGSEHVVGLVGAGARGDMPNAQFEILASLILILLGWVFVPFYLKSGVFTMPEFLERRYSPAARTYLSVISILGYVLTKIAVTIFAGALVFEVLGIPFWQGAILVVLATGIYTMLGGLRAVIYTDMLQLFILLGGAIAMTWFGLRTLGGWGAMMQTLESTGAGESTRFLSLWRPASDPSYPWTGMLFGAPILGVWYWCTDQFIVQRVLSARSREEARRGTIFAGFLKQLPLFLFVIPGIIAYSLSVRGVIPSLAENGDRALPLLVTHLFPAGLRGLMLAALLAALMSSLSSVFNSASTLITIDFYRKWKPDASDRSVVRFGRISTAVLVTASLLAIPYLRSMMESGGLFRYLQSVQAYISPPIAAAFLIGLFSRRINATGALASLWVGFAFGITRLALEYAVTEGLVTFSDGSIGEMFVSLNFLHFALALFVLCGSILVLASRLAPAPSDAKLESVAFHRGTRLGGTGGERALTIALVALVLVVWFVFSPFGIAG